MMRKADRIARAALNALLDEVEAEGLKQRRRNRVKRPAELPLGGFTFDGLYGTEELDGGEPKAVPVALIDNLTPEFYLLHAGAIEDAKIEQYEEGREDGDLYNEHALWPPFEWQADSRGTDLDEVFDDGATRLNVRHLPRRAAV